MRRTRRYFPNQRPFNMGGVKTPRGIVVPVGGSRGVSGPSFDDIVDSPDWDTYPISGQATNWSIQNGVATMEAPTPVPQAIVYRDYEFRDGQARCQLVNAWDQGVEVIPDMFMAMRIVDNENYIGIAITSLNIIVYECIGGFFGELINYEPLPSIPTTITLTCAHEDVTCNVGGDERTAVTTHLATGRVGIIARDNNATPPIGTFRGLGVIDDTQAIFSLDLTNPQGTESRAPGNIYAWNGSRFKLFTDNTAPITIGVPDNGIINTPTLTVGNETVYPLYPEWTKGESVVTGDQRWINFIDGTTRVVTFTQDIASLPQPELHDPATYSLGANYIPQLGVYFEPATTQLMPAGLVTGGDWPIRGSLVTPTSDYLPNLVEGAEDTRNFRFQANGGEEYGVARANFAISAGEKYFASILIEIDDWAKVSRFEVAAKIQGETSARFRISNDRTIEEINLPAYKLQWINERTFFLHLEMNTAISAQTYADVTVIAEATAGNYLDVAAHCRNLYLGDHYKYLQPIPYYATRPSNTEVVLGTSQEFFGDTGLNDEATILIATDDTGFKDGVIRGGLITMRAGTAGSIIYLQDNSETLTNLRVTSYVGPGNEVEASHPNNVKLPYTARLSHSDAGDTLNMNSVQTGTAVVTGIDNEYSPRVLDGNFRLNVNGTIIGALRYVVLWNESEVIPDWKFEQLFGPGNFEG